MASARVARPANCRQYRADTARHFAHTVSRGRNCCPQRSQNKASLLRLARMHPSFPQITTAAPPQSTVLKSSRRNPHGSFGAIILIYLYMCRFFARLVSPGLYSCPSLSPQG